jgi:hypothetical protein
VISQNLKKLFKEFPDKLLIIPIVLTGLILLFIAIISSKFEYEIALDQKPIILLVLLLFSAGVVYLFLIKFIPNINSSGINILFIFVTGLILRLLFLFTPPILEDDFYRYLWDGANLANGINPYRIPPEIVINKSDDEINIPPKMQKLADESDEIIFRINHPYVRTIYPIITQMCFALAYFLKPWSVIAWKFVLLSIDVLFVFILLTILRELKVSTVWISLYWWNPLLIKEIFNSGHMDILIFPFLFLALLFSIRNNINMASVCLGLAVNVKIWPVLLLPLILKPLLSKPQKMIVPLGLFIGLLLFTLIPANPLQDLSTSSFYNYSTRWQLNDSLFKLFLYFSQTILRFLKIEPVHSQMLARIMVMTVVILTVFGMLFRKNMGERALFENCLIIVSVLFLVNPTQFPWYYCWIIPFLCIQPRFSLMLLTPLLSLYYLRYYLQSINNEMLFDNWLVWLQYIPVWIVLLIEYLLPRKFKLQDKSIYKVYEK